MSSDQDNQRPGDSRPKFSFPMLSQGGSDTSDVDLEFQTRKQSHWAARKACAALKVTSSIINALVIHPGGESDDASLAGATKELMARATALTDAASELLDLKPSSQNYAGHRNLIRQQAAEVVATQWRMAHGNKTRELSVDQIAAMYQTVLDGNAVEGEGQTLPYPVNVDFVTAKRLAILGVVPEIYNAVNAFDYFVPDCESLVEKGVSKVVAAADLGVSRMAGPNIATDTLTMLTQSLVGKAGALYAANYRAQARKDIMALQQMSQIERQRHIHAHRAAGLPTGHVDESFARLMGRMVDMVCESVPELQSSPEGDPSPPNARNAESRQHMQGGHHDHQPD